MISSRAAVGSFVFQATPMPNRKSTPLTLRSSKLRFGKSLVCGAKPMPRRPTPAISVQNDRPVGVGIDGTGALLVADDAGNTLWRIAAADGAVTPQPIGTDQMPRTTPTATSRFASSRLSKHPRARLHGTLRSKNEHRVSARNGMSVDPITATALLQAVSVA